MTRLLSRTFALAAVATLLSGAACGGSDTSTSTSTADADRAMAQRIVLTSADLPGFDREPEDSGAGSAGDPIDECVGEGSVFGPGDKPRGAVGAAFTRLDGARRVESVAVFAEKEAGARRSFSDLEAALAGECFKDGLTNAMEASSGGDLAVQDISFSKLASVEGAEQSFVHRFTVATLAEGAPLTLYFDMTILRRGRVVAGVFTAEAGRMFPDAQRIRLSELVAERMAGKGENVPDEDEDPAPTVATTAFRPSTTTAAAAAVGGYERFRDPSGVTLEHPEAWTVEPSSGTDPMALIIDPEGTPFRRNVTIIRQESAAPATLDEYTESSLEEIEAMHGAEIADSSATTLSGGRAFRVSYRVEVSGEKYRSLAVWTIHDGRVWLVTYTSDLARYNPGLPGVDRLLESIRLPA